MVSTMSGIPQSERREVLLDAVSIALFAGLVLTALLTFEDYGMSWDERDHARLGDDIVTYFQAGMTSDALPRHRTTFGGGYNLAASLFSNLVPHARITTNHLFTALLGLLGLMGAWRLGRLLGGAAGGLLALLLLATLPAYYGQMFNNPKDLPFAVGYIWVLYYLCRLIQAGPRAPLRLWVTLGIALGLGMMVRIGGLLGIVYLAIIVGFQSAVFYLRERRVKPALELLTSLSLRALLATVLAWALMILPWPAAHRAPFSLPFQALGGFTKHYFDAPTLFRGEYVPPNPPPWNYLPDYFLIQLPDVLWLILAIGAVMLAVFLARPDLRRSLWNWRGACIALLFFAVLFPPTYAILRKATICDGLRHFLFVLPPLCVLASLAVLNLFNWLSERSKPAAYATMALLGLGVLAVVVEMVELHPYQYLYFNRTSGGLPAAASQYETEYYAHSFKELGNTFADRLWETERDRYLDGDYQISSCKIEPFILMEHMPANFSFAEGKSEFYAGYLRAGCIYLYPDLPLITVVERQGVALNVVRSWRPEQEARGER
jgi:hypothetical protein